VGHYESFFITSAGASAALLGCWSSPARDDDEHNPERATIVFGRQHLAVSLSDIGLRTFLRPATSIRAIRAG
jgi:hypothetical protein